MNHLLNLLCHSPECSQQRLLDSLLSEEEFLLPEERRLFEFLNHFYQQQGAYPSREMVGLKFGVFLEEGTCLSDREVEYSWRSKFLERAKVKASSYYQEASETILNGGDPSEFLEAANNLLSVGDSLEVLDLEATSSTQLESLVSQRRSKGGVKLGIEEIDQSIVDFESGTCIVIAGFVGNFKTTMALSSSVFNATQGRSSGILTLETPPQILKTQLISSFSFSPSWSGDPIPFQPMLKDLLSPEDKEKVPALEAAYREMPGKVHVFSTSEVRGSLFQALPTAAEQLADSGVKIMYIDHAQLLKYYFPTQDGISAVDRYVKKMTDVAVKLDSRGYDFRICFLSQINREGYRKALRKSGIYDLTCLAEYNELERSAAYVITLFATDELKAANEARVQLLKCRMGQTIEDPISVFVDPAYCVLGGAQSMGSVSLDPDTMGGLLKDEFF